MRAATILAILGTATLLGQAPQFEVATIKPNRSDGGINFPRLQNGTLTASNVSLLMLLQTAYDLTGSQITGPDWLDTDRFDVAGKSPEAVPDTDLMPMLQALLNDRFGVEAHHEMKEMPVYEMIVAKGGLKISPYKPGAPLPVGPRAERGGAAIMGTGTMAQLAKMMTSSAGRPVLDKTGLDGRYGYVLTFTPLPAQPSDQSPDFFTAVQEQLGLKLEPAKDKIDVLVIDHAERVPVEN